MPDSASSGVRLRSLYLFFLVRISPLFIILVFCGRKRATHLSYLTKWALCYYVRARLMLRYIFFL